MSIITDDKKGECYLCGKVGSTELHHIFEGSTRTVCDQDKLTVYLCSTCHRLVHSSKGNEAREYLHKLAQGIYEDKIGTREEFIKRYIKSYL